MFLFKAYIYFYNKYILYTYVLCTIFTYVIYKHIIYLIFIYLFVYFYCMYLYKNTYVFPPTTLELVECVRRSRTLLLLKRVVQVVLILSDF